MFGILREIGFVLGLFGFVWLCFGFVFPASAKCLFFIILCWIGAYVYLSILEIGFVLHK